MASTNKLGIWFRTRRRRATSLFLILTVASFALLIVGLITAEPLWGAAGMVAGALAENRRRLVIAKVARVDGALRLTSRYRMAFRSMLMLLVVAAATDSDVALLLATGAFVASIQIGMAGVQLFIRRARRTPIPRIVHNIELDTKIETDRSIWRKRQESTVRIFAIFEAAVFVAVAFALPENVDVAIGIAVAGTLVVAAYVLWVALSTWNINTSELRDQQIETVHQAILDYDPEIVIYIVAVPREFFFVTQWLDAFNSLEKRALWIVRNYTISRRLSDTPWPVVFAPDTRSVEAAIGPNTEVAFYVANTGRNVHLVRHADIKHVFLNHGDSDKATSASPVARMYDEIWVAGDAAAERYDAAGIELRPGSLRLIGRPQVEPLIAGPLGPPEERRIAFLEREAADREEKELPPLDPSVFEPQLDPPSLRVLYAPTFEGHFADINYSSLEEFGPQLIEEILTHRPDIGIIFRPHPSTGRHRAGMEEARAAIVRMLAEAPNAHMHTYVPRNSKVALYDNMNDAEVLISDVSSVVTDFMATKRPILVSNPRNVTTDEYLALFPNQRGCYIFGTDRDAFMDLLTAALTDDPEKDTRARTEQRLLGIHPNGPMRTFVDAANDLYEEAAAADQANTFRYASTE